MLKKVRATLNTIYHNYRRERGFTSPDFFYYGGNIIPHPSLWLALTV